MVLSKKFVNLCFRSLLLYPLLNSLPLAAYELPPANSEVFTGANTRLLKELSEGVGAIAETSKKALVFVSVSKTVKGYPYGMVDPFELFGFGRRRIPAPKQEGVGSGFIIDIEKGYVITNNHVIEGADEISLKLANGESYQAKVLGEDPNTDIAVVQIKDKDFKRKELGALILGHSSELKVGAFVVALGAPFGLEASVSLGTVSALGRGSLSITQLGDFIQTDAVINPGNSGGPLVDMNGKVVGMNTAIYSPSGGSSGVGFAVPSDLVRQVATQLINGVKISRGYIGIYFQPLSEEILSWLNLPKDTKGVIVAQVESEGPAAKAGVRPKDVIVAIDGKKVEHDRDLVNRIGLMQPGHKTELSLLREGKKISAQVSIGNYPGSEEQASSSSSSGSSDDTLGLQLELKEGGLYVRDVAPQSPAANRLRPGDVILSVDRYEFSEEKNLSKALGGFRKALRQARQNKQNSVVMRIKRGDQGFAFLTIDI